MATIASAIKLNDMMSAPLRHIVTAMDGMLSAWNSLEASTAGGLDVGNVESVRANLKLATQGLDDMEEQQKQFNKEVQNGSNLMDGLTGNILGAVGAFAGMAGLGQLINLSDTYTQTQARLAMIVDEGSNVEEMTDKIFASAQRARTGFQGMADMVAKLSLQAGDAFTSNDEAILFAENLNKMYAVAGTSAESVASANLQLTQALGSGVLRGEEFNAVFEAAPNVMETVADYMNVPVGKLREMAAEGQITADIVKNALLGATEEINAQFESMPMTWGQVWTGVMNELYYASIPILEAISWMAQNWSVLEPIVIGVAAAIGLYTGAILLHNGVAAISALVESVRAAALTRATGATFSAMVAQHGLNAAMLASPITWIIGAIILVITLIYAVVAAINNLTGSTLTGTGVIMGALAVAGAFIWNLFMGLLSFVIGIFVELWNLITTFVNFFANVFNDPVGAIANLFVGLFDFILGIVQAAAELIDKVLGSDLSGAVQGFRHDVSAWTEDLIGEQKVVLEKTNTDQMMADMGLNRIEYGDAWAAGNEFGDGLQEKVGGMFGADAEEAYKLDELTKGVGDIDSNTGAISDSLEITHEDLKYLRDIAEQDAINRFTTAEIRVEMGGVNNTVNQNMDLDGVVDYMVTGVQEAMERVAEGVHE